MSLEATPAPGGEVQPIAAPVSTPAADTTPISPRDAGRALAARRVELRSKPKEPDAPAAVSAVEPPQELAETPSAAPEEVPGETTQAAEPAELPPIEPPRSWTKDEKDRFKSYPRELQAYLSEREQERDRDIRQRQNEAAEKLKGLTAKEQEVEKARQQYEQALPALLQTLQEQQAGQFSDIKSMADVQKLAADDPFRYLQWQAHQQNVAAVQNEIRASQDRQAKDHQSQWATFAQTEDKKFADKVPELADPAQKTKLQEAALGALKDVGFSESELGAAWNGQASLSLRDHRVQLLIRDAVRFREAQEKLKTVTAKPVPPVQRPGVAPPKGAAESQNLKALSNKLDQTGNAKDAARLIAERRRASAR
jgi:hypothetical protein